MKGTGKTCCNWCNVLYVLMNMLILKKKIKKLGHLAVKILQKVDGF